MSETVHRLWRYSPMVVEEAMIYENGDLYPDQIGETRGLSNLKVATTFECECGASFSDKEKAVNHLEEEVESGE